MSRIIPTYQSASSSSSSSRQIAPLPHSSTSHPQQQHQQQQQQITKRWTSYTPNPIELYPGPKNRLFLSLRSGIDEEIDYALPKLVVASYDDPDQFKLETWVDSVSALKEWPEKWVQYLELQAAQVELKEQQQRQQRPQVDSSIEKEEDEKRNLALSIIPEWTQSPKLIDRAINSLLVLRNSSFTSSNAKIICRTSFLSFLNRFFNLPLNFLLEISIKNPEPIHHILNILQSIFPYLKQNHLLQNEGQDINIRFLFNQVLPKLLIHSRDQSIIQNLLPLLIMGLTIDQHKPSIPIPILKELIEHLLQIIILRPTTTTTNSTTTTTNSPSPILLDLILDLLISLTQNPIYSKTILCSKGFSIHLKNLTALLEYGSRQTQANWENNINLQGKVIRNPASDFIRNENSQKRRKLQRESNQKQMTEFLSLQNQQQQQQQQNLQILPIQPPIINVDNVGDKPPILNKLTKERLYNMREPNRSISWMHETFVYSSTSQLLQVTFWHAYRDFFQNPSTVDPLLSASEVIKNVTIAFPGAMAKVWTDGMGGQKFVIAGMGFRKGNDDQDRFACLWRDCPTPFSPTNPTSLLSHIQSNHLRETHLECQWGNCQYRPFTLSHLLTHLPLVDNGNIHIPEVITSDPWTSSHEAEMKLQSKIITNRIIPNLAKPFKLNFLGSITPIDSINKHPIGTSFLTSLILRNLSKSLKHELNLINVDLLKEKESEKKKHLLEERFGLPIPDSVLKEEKKEEEESLINLSNGQEEPEDVKLIKEQLENAKNAFINIQDKLQVVAENNISGLAIYLGDALGW
ncbi:uncharacterized protein L201_000056 [Kwoniella dendrophila CBS 6074]|uniref:RFX-type winged-helix domain-containing protein n=1 Tax=Kwoniella dendrophila CBS 6074 TaxID=1295534 RepID=A0AAX4JK71_9TREE